jgi:predicted metal-dependent phosphoesterase TrpH
LRRVDLHVHSTASDGTLPPSRLVGLARRCSLACLALCDHDTVDGLEEFFRAGRELDFPVVGGLELSLNFSGTTHLLGLGVLADGTIPKELEAVKNYRLERNLRLLESLKNNGVALDWERVLEISGGGQTGRPHFARAMVEAGYCQTMPEAFDRYLARGRRAYVDKVRPKPEEALGLLRSAGFAPVLAHPVSMGLGVDGLAGTLPRWMDWGLAGLEAYHPDQTPEFAQSIVKICRRFGLVPTAGSDFHGANKKTPLTWARDHSPLGVKTLAELTEALGR